MRMMIQRANGTRCEAVLLAFDRTRMRAAVAGSSDIVEFTELDGRWIDESGETINFEALLPIDGIGWSRLCANVFPRTAAVGGIYN